MKHVFTFLAIFLALTALAKAQVVSVFPAQNALNIAVLPAVERLILGMEFTIMNVNM